jgi:CDP-paratose 2-epimerase
MRFLITGGAGFIGSNTADTLLSEGHEVIILDNLHRPGSEKNLQWLQQRYSSLPFHQVDVRDMDALEGVLRTYQSIDVLYHFAAQVAVTTSVSDPRQDFEINALGTLNLLEAVRSTLDDPIVLYASTNKVYGDLANVRIEEEEKGYKYLNLPQGISEDAGLDFYSPYGCSKGAADQYMHDYHRIYGMRTIVFRNSCIYGPRQFGVEDQGWLAWFVIAAALGKPITIYGNGKQVRDVLHVNDLIKAMSLAVDHISVTAGNVYNIGGGIANSLSVWVEFKEILENLVGAELTASFGHWRSGDQKIYISDISRAERDFGWRPTIGITDGIEDLYRWVKENENLFA